MELPLISVCLLTYDRLEYALRTLHSTLGNLVYDGPIQVHIADDGSSPEYRRALMDAVASYAWINGISVSNSERQGYGANYNLAMQTVHQYAGIIMPLEDDWELKRKLDLNRLVQVFFEADWVGCIRLGYLGFTQQLYGRVVSAAGQIFLHLDPNSPEPHVWSGHPRLETRRFQREVGQWPTGVDPGTTEFQVAHRHNARQGVLWPLDLPILACQSDESLYAHIGEIQARSDQR